MVSSFTLRSDACCRQRTSVAEELAIHRIQAEGDRTERKMRLRQDEARSLVCGVALCKRGVYGAARRAASSVGIRSPVPATPRRTSLIGRGITDQARHIISATTTRPSAEALASGGGQDATQENEEDG